MPETPKALRFLGSSLDDLRDFPEEVRRGLGVELLRVQYGGMPLDFKALPKQ